MKSIFLFPLAGLLSTPLFAAPMPENGEVLAVNSVAAEYVGTKDSPCHFRTADCPDRCGHATTLASFRVLKNEAYQRPGKYGDDKAEAGDTMLVDVRKDIPGQDKSVAREIAALQPGDAVRMTVTHFYVNDKGNHYPIRPVTAFEKAAKLPAATPVVPSPDAPGQSGIQPL